ncbi:TPA: CBS domain-containing protein, partial [bacterium]|nr:CBS domain-containing protein [bacterium]
VPVVEGERAVAVLSCRTLIRHISEVYPGAVFNLPPKFDQKFDTLHGA